MAGILQQLKSQSIDAHRRIDFLTGRLKTTQPLIPAGEAAADAVEQAKARLLDLQVKQQQLQERYVGDVKPLQDAAAEIDKLRQFVTRNDPMNRKVWSQRNTAYDDMAVALNRAMADAAPLDQQIALRGTGSRRRTRRGCATSAKAAARSRIWSASGARSKSSSTPTAPATKRRG